MLGGPDQSFSKQIREGSVVSYFLNFSPCGQRLVHKIEHTMLHIQYSTRECTFAF